MDRVKIQTTKVMTCRAKHPFHCAHSSASGMEVAITSRPPSALARSSIVEAVEVVPVPAKPGQGQGSGLGFGLVLGIFGVRGWGVGVGLGLRPPNQSVTVIAK